MKMFESYKATTARRDVPDLQQRVEAIVAREVCTLYPTRIAVYRNAYTSIALMLFFGS